MPKFNILSKFAVFAVAATVIPSGITVSVPERAVDHSPALESVTFIHYRDGSAKPVSPAKSGSTVCYSFISKGAKLVSIENILVNSASASIPESDLLAQTSAGAAEWDRYTSAMLLGSVSANGTANFDSMPDGLNEISFGPYSDSNVIAVTRVWGIFSGPFSGRYIDQFDMLFNTAYKWGDVIASGNAGLMDYLNIFTHELGHGLGLADLYNTCVNETMYGYSNYGETNKRDLNAGDIQGLRKLYGA